MRLCEAVPFVFGEETDAHCIVSYYGSSALLWMFLLDRAASPALAISMTVTGSRREPTGTRRR